MKDAIKDLEQALQQRFPGLGASVTLGTDSSLGLERLPPSNAHPEGWWALTVYSPDFGGGRLLADCSLEYRIGASRKIGDLVTRLEEVERLLDEEVPRAVDRFNAAITRVLGEDES